VGLVPFPAPPDTFSESFPVGKKVLAIVASPMGKFSASTTVMNGFLDEYKKRVPDATINIIDIFTRTMPPFTAKRVQAKFATFVGQAEPKDSEEEWKVTKDIIDEFKWADTYVFAIPMWNLAIPNQLKLYLDHIVQPHKTFDPTKADGGLIRGKPAFVFVASGASLLGSPYDFVTPYFRSILQYIGFTDIKFVFQNGTGNPQTLQDLLTKSTKEAVSLLKDVVPAFIPQSAIEKLLKAYETHFNAGDAAELLKLFTDDAVLMPDARASCLGKELISKEFHSLFAAARYDVHFEIEDIVEEEGLGIGRLVSRGKKMAKDDPKAAPEKVNRSNVFLFKKEADGWKVSNYIFNRLDAN